MPKEKNDEELFPADVIIAAFVILAIIVGGGAYFNKRMRKVNEEVKSNAPMLGKESKPYIKPDFNFMQHSIKTGQRFPIITNKGDQVIIITGISLMADAPFEFKMLVGNKAEGAKDILDKCPVEALVPNAEKSEIAPGIVAESMNCQDKYKIAKKLRYMLGVQGKLFIAGSQLRLLIRPGESLWLEKVDGGADNCLGGLFFEKGYGK